MCFHCVFTDSKPESPGVVYVKTGSSEPEERICLLKSHIQNVPHTLPPVKPPAGLSLDRQKYLYKEIRPFLDDDKKDLTAPCPEGLADDNGTPQQQTSSKRRRH